MTNIQDYQGALKLERKYKYDDTRIRNASDSEERILKKRIARRTSEEPTVRKWLQSLIIERLEALAQGLPNPGYSMGSSYAVVCNGLAGYYDTTSNYANSCKYKPTWGSVRLSITPQELRSMEKIGGLITYIYPNQKTVNKRCRWLTGEGNHSRMELVWVEGWISGDYHHTDRVKAIEGRKRLERARKEKVRREREDGRKQAQHAKAMNRAKRQQYAYMDSVKAGNCEAGTLLFIRACGLDRNQSYRGTYLIKMAEKYSPSNLSRVMRVIEHRAKEC